MNIYCRKEADKLICRFCEGIFALNKEQGLPEEESIIYQDENIYVMPDISPLAVGHILIVARQHYQGYASAGIEIWQSVRKFLTLYEQRIGSTQYTIFEHGAVIPYHAGSSIDHAHIHVLPVLLPLAEILERDFGKGYPCALEDLSAFEDRGQPYLYYMLGTQQQGMAYPVGKISSQYLRKIVNQQLNHKPVYDWKQLYCQSNTSINFYKTLIWWNGLCNPAPFKWRKKLLLVKYGLTDYHSLIEETVRLQSDENVMVRNLLEKELQCGQVCRIVLVPMGQQYKLPNYVVENEDDLKGLEAFFSSHKGYKEIWCFSDALNSQTDCFCGRISYNWAGSGSQQIIEMVSGISPRQLEKYVPKLQEMDYLRFVQRQGSRFLLMDDVDLGINQYSIDGWLNCFGRLRQALDLQEENLRHFRYMFRRHEVRSFSLDFQVRDTTLSFIDWDSSNDLKIVESETL